MKTHRPFYIYGVVILILSLFPAGGLALCRSTHRLQDVSQAVYSDGYLFGMEMTTSYYYIFRINTEDKTHEFFRYPVVKGNHYHSLKHMAMGPDGNLYIYHVVGDLESGEMLTQTVDFCDFETGNLENVWAMDEVAGDYFYLINMKEMGLTLMTIEQDEMFWYRLYSDGSTVLEKEASMPLISGILHIGDEMAVWEVTVGGTVYKIQDNGTGTIAFCNDGSQVGVDNVDYEFEGNQIHFRNISDGKNYLVDLEKGMNQVQECKEHEQKTAVSFDSSKLLMKSSNSDDSIYYGILPLENGHQVPAIYGDGGEMVVDTLKRGAAENMKEFFLDFSIIACAGLVFFGTVYRMGKQKNGAPVWGAITMLMIPIIGIGYAVHFNMIDAGVYQEGEQGKIREMARIGRDMKHEVPFELFAQYRQKEIFEEEDAMWLNQNLDAQMSAVWTEEAGEETGPPAYMFPQLFFYRDGEIYSACTWYQFNVPMQYLCPADEYYGMKQAVDQNQVTATTYMSDDGIRELCVCIPMTDDKGEIVGVLKLCEEIHWMLFNYLENSQVIKLQLSVVSIALLVLVQIILWWNMRPLRRLKYTVLEVADGNLKAEAGIKGKGEIAEIGRLFDRMTRSIRVQTQEITDVRRKYQAFVPEELFRLLRKKGIRDVQSQDEKEFWAAVLAVNSPGYKKAVEKDPEGIFAYSNRCLEFQIPAIRSHGGIIRRLSQCGEESIFLEHAQKQALDAAISILTRLKGMETGLCAGIAREYLKLGVIGSGRRMSLALISSHGGLSWFLQQMGEDLNCSILITGDASMNIPDFRTAYHSRILGYIYLTAAQKLEILYEVLDGAGQDRLRIKSDTREEFEEGVRLFMSGRLPAARKRFIHVLEMDHEDWAARRYVLLCEEKTGRRETADILCLDRY